MHIVKSLVWIFIQTSLVKCLTYEEWKAQNPRASSDATSVKSESAAKDAYEENQKRIEANNQNPKSTYVMSNNENSAMTESERMQFRKGYKSKNETDTNNKNSSSVDSNVINNGMKEKARKSTTVSKATNKVPRDTTRKTTRTTTRKGQTTKPSTTTKPPTTTKPTTTIPTTFKPTTTNKSTNRSTTKNTKTTQRKKSKREISEPNSHQRSKRFAIPTTYDISTGLTVKDQKNCAASWAFAAATLIEYQSIMNKSNVIVSEQNLIDCDAASSGCSFGHPFDGLKYALSAGITDAKSYPYIALGQTCKIDSTMPLVYPNHICYQNLGGNETLLMMQLLRFGPIATGISTAGTGFDFYKSGVFNDAKCSSDPKKADLAIVVVGYGTDSSTNTAYWLVKLAWGTTFGLNGYIRMARNAANQCGIANFVTFLCPQ